MITYGLVKQVGPYSSKNLGISSYNPRARDTEIISPRYPYTPSMGHAVYNKSRWAKRQVLDREGYANPKLRKVQATNEMKELELKTMLGKVFGATFQARVTPLPHSISVSQALHGIPGGDPEWYGTDSGGNTLGAIPGSMPSVVERDEPEEPEVKEEDIEEANLVPLDEYGVTPNQFSQGISQAFQTATNIFSMLDRPISSISNQMAVLYPVITHFINTRQLALEGGMRLLLGPSAGDLIIRLMRQDERIRRFVTERISQYAIQPAADLLRNFAINPSAYLSIVATGTATTDEALVPTSTLPGGGSVYDTLMDTLSNLGVTAASQVLPGAQQTTGSIIRTFINLLQISADAPRQIEQLANTVSGAVTFVGPYTLRARDPVTGLVVNPSRVLNQEPVRQAVRQVGPNIQRIIEQLGQSARTITGRASQGAIEAASQIVEGTVQRIARRGGSTS